MATSHVQFSLQDDLMHFDERHFLVINKGTVSKWFGLIKKINFLDYKSIKYFSLQNFSQITSPAFDLKTQQLMSVCISQVANLDIWFDINPYEYMKKKSEKQFPFSVHHATKISKKIWLKFNHTK